MLYGYANGSHGKMYKMLQQLKLITLIDPLVQILRVFLDT